MVGDRDVESVVGQVAGVEERVAVGDWQLVLADG